VALLAFALLQYLMNIRPGEDLILELSMAFDAFLAFECSLLFRGFGLMIRCQEENPCQQSRKYYEKSLLS
jgi:hypothetical protein